MKTDELRFNDLVLFSNGDEGRIAGEKFNNTIEAIYYGKSPKNAFFGNRFRTIVYTHSITHVLVNGEWLATELDQEEKHCKKWSPENFPMVIE